MTNYKDYYYKYKALKYYLKNNSIENQKQIKGGSSSPEEELKELQSTLKEKQFKQLQEIQTEILKFRDDFYSPLCFNDLDLIKLNKFDLDLEKLNKLEKLIEVEIMEIKKLLNSITRFKKIKISNRQEVFHKFIEGTKVLIPDFVVRIPDNVFKVDNKRKRTTTTEETKTKLTSVKFLGNNVTEIGDFAFSNNSLDTVDIPYSVTEIGNYAFYKNALTSVKFLGNNVTKIGNSAFSNNALTSVKFLGNNVTEIGIYAFYKNALGTVDIPDSVTKIGDYAFSNNALTSVKFLGNNVTEISDGAFSNNNALKTVYIPRSSINDYNFKNLINKTFDGVEIKSF